jgi:hypothetical protein
VGQRLQGNRGFGDDLDAVGAGNALLLLDAVGQKAWEVRGLLPLLTQSDLAARDEVQLLVLVVVDAHPKTGFDEVFVGHLRPAAAPL